jgi:hypothetical protein
MIKSRALIPIGNVWLEWVRGEITQDFGGET